jgi:sulfinoalanine decarboxylase/sulfinoalanine decarboxylase/aspartate 1-decarboxylase
MLEVSDEIKEFFNKLCEDGITNYKKLISEFNITYEKLIPYASWSSEKYKRICLGRNDICELVLICWMPGQKTKIHDHDGQLCQVYFLKGQFEECTFENEDLASRETEIINSKVLTKTTERNDIHQLANVSNELAMTLHLYSKPIENCNTFVKDWEEKEVNLSYDIDCSGSEENCEMEEALSIFNELSKEILDDEIVNPMAERIPVEELHNKLDIKLSDQGLEEGAYYDNLKDIVLATPKTSSKRFFNQLFGGRQPKAVLGDLLAVMLNNSMYTYKVAGVQVGIEKEILGKLIDMAGYPEDAGGTFPTGGSMSNFMSILMARDKYDGTSSTSGISESLVAYTSEESHYSIQKNAAFIGLGRDNVRKVVSDSDGRMDVAVLEKLIQEDIRNGKKPFFINATAGTTVLGVFDNFELISNLCKKHDLWLHIDGAYTGAAIFSEKHKHLLNGIEKSDSFSFNPHKMLGTPMTCSVILVKDKKHLYQSFANDADYLYQTDADEYNLGKTSFQCGRRNDALKFWTLWKAIGTKGLEEIVDHQFHLAKTAKEYILSNPDYKLYSEEDTVSVCFNYKNIDANELCTALYEHNELMVGFGQFKGEEFVRLVTINANNSVEDLLNFFKVLEEFADANFN